MGTTDVLLDGRSAASDQPVLLRPWQAPRRNGVRVPG